MPEEDAFHQIFRYGGAVHRDEPVPRSAARDMYQPGKQFFASAGLATNQDGNSRIGKCLGDLERLSDRRVVADDAKLADQDASIRDDAVAGVHFG